MVSQKVFYPMLSSSDYAAFEIAMAKGYAISIGVMDSSTLQYYPGCIVVTNPGLRRGGQIDYTATVHPSADVQFHTDVDQYVITAVCATSEA